MAGDASDLTLRPATAADAAAVTAVFLASRRHFIPYAPLAHDDAAIAHWLADLVDRSGTVTVATTGDGVVGFVAVSIDEFESWIDQLYLAPGSTRRGIGSALLAHALRQLPRRRPVRLYTFQANTAARAFYERHGFRPIAEGDGADNEEGRPDVLYELPARPHADSS